MASLLNSVAKSPTANAYFTAEECDIFAQSVGIYPGAQAFLNLRRMDGDTARVAPSSSETQEEKEARERPQEQIIILATEILDRSYTWRGDKREPRVRDYYPNGQRLEWPRDGCVDNDGYSLSFDVVDDYILKPYMYNVLDFARWPDRIHASQEPDSLNVMKTKSGSQEVAFDKNDRAWIITPYVEMLLRSVIYLNANVGKKSGVCLVRR